MYPKRLPQFDYLAPKTVDEVLEMLGQHRNQARLMAGGTIVIHRMKERVAPRKYLVGLKNVQGLDQVLFKASKGLSVGSTASFQTIANSAEVQKHYPLLAQVCGSVWTPQTRNMATLGGNVACKLSTAQSIPVLTALGAEARIMTRDGEKVVTIDRVGEELKDDGLLTGIDIPVLPEGTRISYQRYAVREKYDWAIAAAAVAIRLSGGVCESVTIGLGGVPVRSARAKEAEEVLRGQTVSEELIEKAAGVAVGNRSMPSDEMFSEQHKKKVLRAMVKRALTEASLGQ